MRILFASSMIGFCAVFYVLLLVVSRLHSNRLDASYFRALHRHRPSNEFFEAGDCRTPRRLRISQSVAPRHSRTPVEEVPVAPTLLLSGPGRLADLPLHLGIDFLESPPPKLHLTKKSPSSSSLSHPC